MCSIWCRMFQRKSEMPHSSPAFEYVTWLIPLSFHESLWFDRIRLCSWALVSLCAFCFRPLIFFSPQGDSTSRRSEKNPLLRNELKKTTRGIYKLRQQSVFPFVKTFFHKKVLTLANTPPAPPLLSVASLGLFSPMLWPSNRSSFCVVTAAAVVFRACVSAEGETTLLSTHGSLQQRCCWTL